MAKKRAAKSVVGREKESAPVVQISIPPLKKCATLLRITGDRPLLLNSKWGVAWMLAAQYQKDGKGGGKSGNVPIIKVEDLSPDEQYELAFYTLPSSPAKPPSGKGLYGVPASGIKKCFCSAIRCAGFTDNTTIGLIAKSFSVLGDEGGLCLIRHNGFVRDERPVDIGSGQKNVPNIRRRPLFPEWEMHLRITFNDKTLSQEMVANLAMYAGQYIGLCELRSEKKQGECGGFVVGDQSKILAWATDKHWGVSTDTVRGFYVTGNGKPRRRRSSKG